MERLGNPDPARILMIGDSLTADIAGGDAAGLDTVWYNPAFLPNNSEVKPAFEIHALAELEAIAV
jgi:2-haloacid dehalogenase